jgi:hypothetical protein
MNSNVITLSDAMVTMTDAAYAAVPVYLPYTPRLCGGEPKLYEAGRLVKTTFKAVSYAITQSFPEDQLTAVLDAAMTEIPQISANSSLFEFNKFAEGVEFIYSELNGMTPADVNEINAETLTELAKKWDNFAYLGKFAGNTGFKTNPKSEAKTEAAGSLSYDGLVASIGKQVKEMKDKFSLTNSDLQISIPLNLDALLDGINSQTGNSKRGELVASYAGLNFITLPAALDSSSVTYSVTALPYVRFHRGALPAIYNTEMGKHGLSTSELFTYESAAVECKRKGAIRHVTLVAA